VAQSEAIENTIRLGVVFAAAAFATALLFIIMLALIATSFDKPVRDATTAEFIVVDTEISAPVIKAKLLDANTSLLNPIELPPAIDSKTTVRATKPQTSPVISTVEGKVVPVRIKPEIAMNLPILNLSSSGSTSTVNAEDSGRHQCTLVAHIGPGTRDVAGIEVMNCLHGEMADAAESALYNWIHGGAKSYLALGAMPGDAVEFTYEENRQIIKSN
jgi:hypothetical protein